MVWPPVADRRGVGRRRDDLRAGPPVRGGGSVSAERDRSGTGPQPKGLGLGSAAALAQKSCTQNGRTSFNIVGGGPFCVNPWPDGKDNGGATAPGVTATEVKVVAYIPNEPDARGGLRVRHSRRIRRLVRRRRSRTRSPTSRRCTTTPRRTWSTFQFWGRSRTSRSSPRVVPMRLRSVPTRSR